MNILAVEPFYHGSHKAFLDGLKKHSKHAVIPVTLSNRGRKWHMHGDSLSLAKKSEAVHLPVDLILASSMTNIPAFLALTNPRFAQTPKILYMHENQLTQPLPNGEKRDQTYCYMNYLSMLSVDKLLFTSQFHYRDFMNALPGFLRHYPGEVHPSTIKEIEQKSSVLHPGLDLKRFDQHPDTRGQNKIKKIVWNQRWQFDRNPAAFFRVLNRLNDAEFEFELILAGDSKHDKPAEFEKACERYGQRITHFGFVEDFEKYSKLLHDGDVVVSTATYEFFCVAVMEAIYCGCHPLVPKTLHYPELIPKHLHNPLLHAPVLYEDEDELFVNLRKILSSDAKCLPTSSLKKINQHLDWSEMIETYDQLFEKMA